MPCQKRKRTLRACRSRNVIALRTGARVPSSVKNRLPWLCEVVPITTTFALALADSLCLDLP